MQYKQRTVNKKHRIKAVKMKAKQKTLRAAAKAK